jgi:hypothetical protein
LNLHDVKADNIGGTRRRQTFSIAVQRSRREPTGVGGIKQIRATVAIRREPLTSTIALSQPAKPAIQPSCAPITIEQALNYETQIEMAQCNRARS